VVSCGVVVHVPSCRCTAPGVRVGVPVRVEERREEEEDVEETEKKETSEETALSVSASMTRDLFDGRGWPACASGV
jgi:hypothetical protein